MNRIPDRVQGPRTVWRMACLLCTLALAPAWTNAEVYRWVDENGRMQFSDRPVSDTAQEIEIRQAPPLYSDDARQDQQRKRKQAKMLEMFQDQRDEKSRLDAEEKRVTAERQKRCARVRDRLRRYQGSALYENLTEGDRRYLTDEERAKVIAETEREVKHWCD